MIKPTIYSDNLFAIKALLSKEISRFTKVWVQTILAPVISSLLFLIIFSYLLNNRLEPLPGIQYSAFLIPGLIMMTLQQNAFSNSSSSLTQSKITGNLIFLMLSPMTPFNGLQDTSEALLQEDLPVEFSFGSFALC